MTDQNTAPADVVLPSDLAENIAPGITCEWLDDRQIVVFTVATVARASLDMLLGRIHQIVTEWPVDRPYLALYHIADSTNGPTPYIRERFREIPRWNPRLDAHVALITAQNFQGKLVQLYARTRGNAVRIFFCREAGIAWLRGFLDGASRRGRA